MESTVVTCVYLGLVMRISAGLLDTMDSNLGQATWIHMVMTNMFGITCLATQYKDTKLVAKHPKALAIQIVSTIIFVLFSQAAGFYMKTNGIVWWALFWFDAIFVYAGLFIAWFASWVLF